MLIRKVHRDGGRLVQHHISVLEHRNQAVWIEFKVSSAFVSTGVTVYEDQSMRNSDLVKQNVRQKANIAGIVVKLDHVEISPPNTLAGPNRTRGQEITPADLEQPNLWPCVDASRRRE